MKAQPKLTGEASLAAALQHAQSGFRVFPLRENSKLPAISRWPERATTDPDAIRRMWTDPVSGDPFPYNIGIATGDGLVVIDVDVRDGKKGDVTLAERERELGPLPPTLSGFTATDGQHLFFECGDASIRSSNGKLGPGLDIKGERGHVVAPGSMINGRAYRWGNEAMTADLPPAWLKRLSASRPAERVKTVVPPPDTPEDIERARSWLLDHAPLALEGDGGDATTVAVANRLGDLVSEPVALDLMLEHWNERCEPPWQPDELEVKVANAYRYRQNAEGCASAAVEFEDVSNRPEATGPPTGARGRQAAAAPARITATRFTWVDPATIPQREWLYGRHLIRGFLSSTIAAGGSGKTSLKVAEALAMVSGRDILNTGRRIDPLRVWLYNLEDPRVEIQRKVTATAKHYGLAATDIEGLFVDSGREQELVIAETARDGAVIRRPVVQNIVEELRANGIDVLIVDPFVSCHRVSENDNSAIDQVAKEWGRIADLACCAVNLVHHTRKMIGFEKEASEESSRGAKALTDACRSNVVLNRMTEKEADRAGIEERHRRNFFRTFDEKNNLAPPAEHADWFQLISVNLGNGECGEGDEVSVVARWQWPDASEGLSAETLRKVQERVAAGAWRASSQAADWVGKAVAEVLQVDLDSTAGKARVKALIKGWLGQGVLVEVAKADHKGRQRPFVEVGQGGLIEPFPHLPEVGVGRWGSGGESPPHPHPV